MNESSLTRKNTAIDDEENNEIELNRQNMTDFQNKAHSQRRNLTTGQTMYV